LENTHERKFVKLGRNPREDVYDTKVQFGVNRGKKKLKKKMELGSKASVPHLREIAEEESRRTLRKRNSEKIPGRPERKGPDPQSHRLLVTPRDCYKGSRRKKPNLPRKREKDAVAHLAYGLRAADEKRGGRSVVSRTTAGETCFQKVAF